MKKTIISSSVRRRLPRYYRFARELLGADVLRISSSELSSMMGITASQIRQDLSLIGEFGLQGYGYNVKDLYSGVGDILGVNRNFSAVICGLSGIGIALANHSVFGARGVTLRALFDDKLAGTEIAGLIVLPMHEFERWCSENKTDIAVLAVPRELAVETAGAAVRAGVCGIWNFTGEDLRADRAKNGITVANVNLHDSLMGLCCSLHNCDGQ
ncbi:MAG: redox-sensing transcriptional repressor Rex [Eubacteriales bacterium]